MEVDLRRMLKEAGDEGGRHIFETLKIDLVESLPKPENLEVSLRYVLKHANFGVSNIFQFFDTTEMPNH